MMHFMIIVKSGGGCEAGQRPGEDLIAAVGNYTQELRKAGVLVELSRLEASAKGARIQFSRGGQIVIDGPFAETKELIGGYWIIQVNSMQEAIEWARRVPAPDGRGEEGEIEIRQFLPVEYFNPNMRFHDATEPASVQAKIKTQAQ
jgi:hypothetical protein